MNSNTLAKAMSKNIFLKYGDEHFPATLMLINPKNPILCTTQKPIISVQLSWKQVESIAKSRENELYINY